MGKLLEKIINSQKKNTQLKNEDRKWWDSFEILPY